jgi:hypothetical protein
MNEEGENTMKERTRFTSGDPDAVEVHELYDTFCIAKAGKDQDVVIEVLLRLLANVMALQPPDRRKDMAETFKRMLAAANETVAEWLPSEWLSSERLQ